MHDSKSLDCSEETVGRNMDVKGDSGEIQEEKGYRERFYCLREYVYCHEQNVSKNMNG